MKRRDTIETLLIWLPDAIDGGGGGLEWISGGPESKTLHYGPLFHDAETTWRELLRALQQLKDEKPVQHMHLVGRHYAGHNARKHIKCTRKNNQLQPQGLRPNQEIKTYGGTTTNNNTFDCVVHTWPTWVSQRESQDALDTLTNLFRGEPYLPRAIYEAA